jgi:hypothetical protein
MSLISDSIWCKFVIELLCEAAEEMRCPSVDLPILIVKSSRRIAFRQELVLGQATNCSAGGIQRTLFLARQPRMQLEGEDRKTRITKT